MVTAIMRVLEAIATVLALLTLADCGEHGKGELKQTKIVWKVWKSKV